MATLTIKNVPDELYERLKKQAARHRRSINSEAIVCLEKALGPREIDVEAFLEEARALRKETPHIFVTEEILRKAKDEGRP